MGGCHIWCKHKEIKTNRCYFLCSVVLQYIFFYFCCLNERNIVVLIFHHQRPLDPSHPVWSRWMLHNSVFFFPFCYSALVFACPFSTHPLTDRRGATGVIISASADHTETLGWGEDAKAALLALCIALKMLHFAAGIMDATSKLLDWYTMVPRPAQSEPFSQSFYR